MNAQEIRNQKARLEEQLRQLEAKMAESDKPENAAKRTPEQLEERYTWARHAWMVRDMLAEVFAAEFALENNQKVIKK
jgi:hypothetical protein